VLTSRLWRAFAQSPLVLIIILSSGCNHPQTNDLTGMAPMDVNTATVTFQSTNTSQTIATITSTPVPLVKFTAGVPASVDIMQTILPLEFHTRADELPSGEYIIASLYDGQVWEIWLFPLDGSPDIHLLSCHQCPEGFWQIKVRYKDFGWAIQEMDFSKNRSTMVVVDPYSESGFETYCSANSPLHVCFTTDYGVTSIQESMNWAIFLLLDQSKPDQETIDYLLAYNDTAGWISLHGSNVPSPGIFLPNTWLPGSASWHPDGEGFISGKPNTDCEIRVSSISLSDRNIYYLPGLGCQEGNFIGWSPDGTKVAYEILDDELHILQSITVCPSEQVYSLDYGECNQILIEPWRKINTGRFDSELRGIQWGTDNNFIFYDSPQDYLDPQRIGSISLDGSIVSFMAPELRPRHLSPDRTRLLYQDQQDLNDGTNSFWILNILNGTRKPVALPDTVMSFDWLVIP